MSNKPNLPTILANATNLESAAPDEINNLFSQIFGSDHSLPDWASAPANGNFFPSAQLSTRDGRVTGNAVLMWWVILDGMPFAVVASDAGNVVMLTANELDEWFFEPEYLMREPLYAHLSGVASSGITIPEEYRFLFEAGGVSLDEDDLFESFVEGPNPIIVAMMEAMLDSHAESEMVEDHIYTPYGLDDEDEPASYDVSITDGDGDTMSASFDTPEELNEFMAQMGIPFQV